MLKLLGKKIFCLSKHVCKVHVPYLYQILLNFFVCIDALSPSQQFCSHVGTFSCLPGLSNNKCLAQGHNTVMPVSLEQANLRSKA